MSESRNAPQLIDRDRNLLFGVLAVQMHKVTASQLVEHAAAWATDPSLSLAERFEQAGVLSRPDRDLISTFVDEAIQAHGGDPSATLNTFSQEEGARHSLQQTLTLLGNGESPSDSWAPTVLAEPLDPDAIPAVQESPGRYTQIGEFAQGGMGRVLLVHDQFLGRQVAMKELLPGAGSSVSRGEGTPTSAYLNRFLQEARITGQLEHPSIVPVYELGHRSDGTLYYTMKFLRGKTLAQAFRERKTLEERSELLSHFVDACQAIAYAHSRGVVHRDIKPSNILIGEFGETVVIDWGLAKALGREDVNACRLPCPAGPPPTPMPEATDTVYGMAIGTPAYMPPEQALGQIERIDERSDIYSLGVVLYELLAGEVPFSEKDPGTVVRKVVAEPAPPVRDRNPQVPPALAAICERAMQKDPEARYGSAKELADEVSRFLAGGLVRAYEYGLGEHLWRFVTRYKGTLAVAALMLMVLFGVGIFSYVRVVQEKSAAVRAQRLAEDAHKRAVAGRERAEQQFYYASIGLADRAIADSRFEEAQGYLMACPPELRDWEWGRLQYLCNLDFMTLSAHGGSANAVAFMPGGQVLVTGGADQAVRLWNLENGRLVGTFEAHAGPIRAVAVSPDGGRIAAAAENGMAQVWEAASGELLLTLAGHAAPATSVAFSPDGTTLATGSEDHTVVLWDARDGARRHVLEGHTEAVTCLAFDPEGLTLATGSADNTVALWSVETGALETSFECHVNDVLAVAFSPDGSMLATGGRDSTARIWNRSDRTLRSALSGHGREITAVGFTPDGTHLLTASGDRTVRLWKVSEEIAPDAPANASLLGGENGSESQVFAGHAGAVKALAIHPDGLRFASGDDEGAAKIWHIKASLPQFPIKRFFDNMGFGEASSDGRFFATQGSNSREVLVWSTVEQRIVAKLLGHSDAVRAVAFNPDSTRLATAGDDRTARLWDVASGLAIASCVGHGDVITSIAFSADGNLLATGSLDRTIRVWDARSGELRHIVDNPGGAVNCLAFSPDGPWLASGDAEHGVALWNAETGVSRGAVGRHAGPVTALCFDEDGRRLASGSEDSNVGIWDLRGNDVPIVLSGHAGAIRSVCFDPAGRRVVTGSDDSTVRVWDAATGQELLSMGRLADPVTFVRFWPVGGNLVTASGRDIISWPHLPVVREPDRPEEDLQSRMEGLKRAFWLEVQKSKPWEEQVEVEDTAATVELAFPASELDELLNAVAGRLRTGGGGLDPAVEAASVLMGSGTESATLARLGMKRGDYVRAVDGQAVTRPEELAEALERFEAAPGSLLRLEVARDQELMFIELRAE